MPNAPSTPCAEPGCGRLDCKEHTWRKRQDRDRGKTTQRGYGADWQRVRLMALSRDHGLCVPCGVKGRTTVAEQVHHIKPIETHPQLRLVLSNLMSVCIPCHDSFTKWGVLRSLTPFRD